MTRENQDPGGESEMRIEQYEQQYFVAMYADTCVVRQGKLSPPSKPDKLAPLSGISSDVRLQIKKPSTEIQFRRIRWASPTGLMDKKPTRIICTIQRQAVSSRNYQFKSNRAVNLLNWG